MKFYQRYYLRERRPLRRLLQRHKTSKKVRVYTVQQPISIEQPLSSGKQKKQRPAVFITQQCLLDRIITAIRVHSGATSQ